MAARLNALRIPLGNLEAMLGELRPAARGLLAAVQYRLPMHNYLVWSTAVSVFLSVMLLHKGIDIFVGYPIVILNTMIVFGQDRLLLHRIHALVLFVVLIVSLAASASSATPAAAVLIQMIGITLFSVYYFSMLTNYGLSVPRWMQIYAQVALAVAVWGLIAYVLRRLHLMPQTPQTRLRAFYPEPSLFVYATLPALGLYVNTFLRYRTHKLELGVFVLCYLLADSSLGFLGMLLIGFFVAASRLNLWKMIIFCMAAACAMVGLFFVSANVRLRVVDTVLGLRTMDISDVNPTTFAVLSNLYVSAQTFLAHPFIGVGIGGYQYAYTKYMPLLGNNLEDPTMLTLNMFDASSLFLRTAAEMGAFGLLLLAGFLFFCGRVKGDQHIDIRNALLPYMFVRMGRYGAWFSMEVYFFVGLYLLNYMHSRAAYRAKTIEAQPPATETRPAG